MPETNLPPPKLDMPAIRKLASLTDAAALSREAFDAEFDRLFPEEDPKK